MILIFAALLGFVSVAFGAFAEHGLREHITQEQFRFLMTAIRYNQVHAVVACAIGLALCHNGRLASIPALRFSGGLFILGTVLFSFSIYLSVWFEMPVLINVTPVGGMTIMAAWLALLASAVTARQKD